MSIELNVVREGQGPIVVLSHALGCDLHMWDGVAASLARAHTVIRYDHRNHGGSAKSAEAFGIETLADDAIALIEREAVGETVHFVGLSMGGMTAQALAARRPDLLRSVVIANSSAFYPDQSPWLARVQTVASQGVAAIAPGAVSRWLTPEWVSTFEGQAAMVSIDYVPTNMRVESPLKGIKILQTDPVRSLDEQDKWKKLFEDTVLKKAGA